MVAGSFELLEDIFGQIMVGVACSVCCGLTERVKAISYSAFRRSRGGLFVRRRGLPNNRARRGRYLRVPGPRGRICSE